MLGFAMRLRKSLLILSLTGNRDIFTIWRAMGAIWGAVFGLLLLTKVCT